MGEYAVMALFVACQGLETHFYAISVTTGSERRQSHSSCILRTISWKRTVITDPISMPNAYVQRMLESMALGWNESTKNVCERSWLSSRNLLTSPLHDRLLIIQVDEVIDKNCDHGSLGFWPMYNLSYAYSSRIKVPGRRLGSGYGRMRPLSLAWPARSRLPV